MSASSLSTHVLDTHGGTPAVGVAVSLAKLDGERATDVASARTDGDGRIATLGNDLAPGRYRLSFEVGAYFRARGATPLFERVSLDLELRGGRHHVPLLASPFACVTYRGS